MQRICVIDQQNLLPQSTVRNGCNAIAASLNRDFIPLCNAPLTILRYTQNPATLIAGEWAFWLVNTIQDAPAGALAWHSRDDRGHPFGVIPIAINLANKDDPITSLDHEIKEALLDPSCEEAYYAQLNGQDAWVLAEVCDPVENDVYQVTPTGGSAVSLSNFIILDAWADASTVPGTRLDFLGKLSKPLTITPGGYFAFNQNGQWSDYPAARQKHELSRQARRLKKWKARQGGKAA